MHNDNKALGGAQGEKVDLQDYDLKDEAVLAVYKVMMKQAGLLDAWSAKHMGVYVPRAMLPPKSGDGTVCASWGE